MEDQEIKTCAKITLKPNQYFTKVDFPYLYQKRMILLMLKRMRMVNGDDVGIGKTIESVVHYSYVLSANSNTRAVVFTERIALEQWANWFKELTPGISTKIITAETHVNPQYRISALRQHGQNVLITTYSTAYDYQRYLLEGLGERFVLYADEPNYFANTSSKIHQHMLEISNKATRSYGLTATIIENRLEEAFGIMNVIYQGLIPGKIYFEDNFCIRKLFRKPRYHVRVMGYKNLGLFRSMIEPGFYGRLATEPEVAQDLPEVITMDIPIRLGKEQSEKLVEAMDELMKMPDGTEQKLTVLTALIRAQQIADDPSLLGFGIKSAKTEALIEVLNGHLKGQKVLVHSKLKTVINHLEERLNKAGIKTVRITGDESTAQRNLNGEIFVTSTDVNVMLMTRAGLKSKDSLKIAPHFYWYDMPWSWGLYRQGMGRIKRKGSTHRKVASYRMLAVLHEEVAKRVGDETTIDGYTLQVLQKKAKLISAITDDTETLEASDSDVLEVYKLIKESFRKKVA